MLTRTASFASRALTKSLPTNKSSRNLQLNAISRRGALVGWACAPALLGLCAAPEASAAFVDEDAAISVFQKVAPSVVTIEDFSVAQGREVFEGVGSGLVWSSYGHIVTNYHCISKVVRDQTGKSSIRVTFDSGREASKSYIASVVGTDPSRDLAVLLVDADRSVLVPVSVGSSDKLKVGQFVYAIGNPSGLSKTQTAGVVSGLNRSIPSPTGLRIPGAIQTDAAISSGNSGGPLVDSSGRLVGVNTATFTKQGTGRSSGVNFAIPVDMVLSVVPKLIVYGQAGEKRI